METEPAFARYQTLQKYVGWTEADASRVQAVGDIMSPHLAGLIDDFYNAVLSNPQTHAVITGGDAQLERLKGTLRTWIQELLSGPYDSHYVVRRRQIGTRHVEIGLDQVYTNAALSRLRNGMAQILSQLWTGDERALATHLASLNKLLDLDLAIIEDSYQAEYHRRQQQSDRLATIGQVAGGVAHEMRNPLNVIKTSVYYLLNAQNVRPEKQAEHLHRIERQVGLADSVVTALNDFARLPLPELRPTDLRTCLDEALEMSPLPAQIRVTTELPASLPPVLGDLRQLRIVFGNLLRNARDAMADGGDLRITAHQQDDAVEVSIHDTGSGIAPEALDRIMEPLYSTKARGIGLGLAITRAIVEKHRGRLQAVSRPGQGSVFTVRLLAAAGPDPVS